MKKLLTLILLIVSTMAAIAQEELTPIIDRITNADYIFEGKVIYSAPYYNHAQNIIYTDNIIQISKIFKGSLICGTVEVITSGGQIGDVILTNSHLIPLQVGNTGIFLCGANDKELPATQAMTPDNANALGMIYENQSYIQYSYVGQDLQISDLTQQFNDLIQLYNLTESVTQISYTDCNNSQTVLPSPPTASQQVYRPHPMPRYSVASNLLFDSVVHLKINHANIINPNRTTSGGTVTYTMSNPILTGTNPRYFEFDINIGSSGGSDYLSVALARFQYDTTVFGGSIASNTKVTITRGAVVSDTIQYPYLSVGDITGDVLAIGVSSDLNPTAQSLISGTPQQLYHVQIEITSCHPNSISFTDQAVMEGNSLYENTPNGTSLLSYSAISATQSLPMPACGMRITSFSPTIIAGGASQSLFIRGYGFGDSIGRGNVFFPNATDGGVSYVGLNTDDIQEWHDTLIKIFLPNLSDTAHTGTNNTRYNSYYIPGSGNFVVLTDNLKKDTSHTPLNIIYSIEGSINANGAKSATLLIDKDTTGGYQFYIDTALWNHPDRKGCVVKAINDWRCLTGVNWTIAGPIVPSSDTAVLDGKNIIQLGYTGHSPLGHILANTENWRVVCGIKVYAKELDLVFDKTVTWLYDTLTSTSLVSRQTEDFYADILHELGHAHSLDHVIDPSGVMDFLADPARPISGANRRIYLAQDNGCGPGGNDVVHRSENATYSACAGATPIAIQYRHFQCSNYYGVDDLGHNLFHVEAYPVPFNNNLAFGFSISSESDIDIKLLDIQGRTIAQEIKEKVPVGHYESNFSLPDLQDGVYILSGHVNGEAFHINVVCSK